MIIEPREHMHQNKLEELNVRDFHIIIYEIFNVIPDNEKEKHIQDLNSMITSWHHQPHEAWGYSWIRLQSYLSIHFSTMDKYKDIVKIFNHQ